MRCWQMDFKDVSSVPADPEGGLQHVWRPSTAVDEDLDIGRGGA
jgi:hypothetical protein